MYVVYLFVKDVSKLCAELLHADEVSVQTTPTYLVASGFWEYGVSEASYQWSYYHNRAPEALCFRGERLSGDVVYVYVVGAEGVCMSIVARYFYPHLFKEFYEVSHIEYVRDIFNCDGVRGEQGSAYDFKGFVFGTLRGYRPAEAMASFNYKSTHVIENYDLLTEECVSKILQLICLVIKQSLIEREGCGQTICDVCVLAAVYVCCVVAERKLL